MVYKSLHSPSVPEMKWWWLFLCSLPSVVVATSDGASKMTIWHIRMLTVVNDGANKAIVSQGVAKLSEHFDVYFMNFVPKTPQNRCQELKKTVDEINTAVVLTLERTNQCNFTKNSFANPNATFVHALSSTPNHTKAMIEQRWNTFAAHVNRTAPAEDSFVSLKSANERLDASGQKCSSVFHLPIWLAVGTIILFLGFVIALILMYITVRKLKMSLKTAEAEKKQQKSDISQKSQKSARSGKSVKSHVALEASGKSKKTERKQSSTSGKSQKTAKSEKRDGGSQKSQGSSRKSSKKEDIGQGPTN